MKKKIFAVLLAVSIIINAVPAQTGANTTNAQLAQQVVTLVNAERAKEGLLPLTANIAGLNSAAMLRAEEIIVYWSHTRPDGRSPFTTLGEFNVVYQAAGENIAQGQRNPEAVMTSWMNSPDHRKNIMSSNYKHIGVGVAADSAGRLSWVQLFINCRNNCEACSGTPSTTPPASGTDNPSPTSPPASQSTTPPNSQSTPPPASGTDNPSPTSPPATQQTSPPNSQSTPPPDNIDQPYVYKIMDALNILKHIAKMQELTPEQVELYDFFGNGEIKIVNALEILKYIAGMYSLAGRKI